jgi:hypothetical protein
MAKKIADGIVWQDPPVEEQQPVDGWAQEIGLALKDNPNKWGMIFEGTAQEVQVKYMIVCDLKLKMGKKASVWFKKVFDEPRGKYQLYAIWSATQPDKY